MSAGPFMSLNITAGQNIITNDAKYTEKILLKKLADSKKLSAESVTFEMYSITSELFQLRTAVHAKFLVVPIVTR